jgi:predicted RNase H-like HicB family nuclease
MQAHKYTIVLDPWPDGNGYTVTVPALPGCVTQGKSRREAIKRAQEAIRCHIEGLNADNLPVPQEHAAPTLATVEV